MSSLLTCPKGSRDAQRASQQCVNTCWLPLHWELTVGSGENEPSGVANITVTEQVTGRRPICREIGRFSLDVSVTMISLQVAGGGQRGCQSREDRGPH